MVISCGMISGGLFFINQLYVVKDFVRGLGRPQLS